LSFAFDQGTLGALGRGKKAHGQHRAKDPTGKVKNYRLYKHKDAKHEELPDRLFTLRVFLVWCDYFFAWS
jgi:hypothetical protein